MRGQNLNHERIRIMQLLAELFIWWHKQTLGVRLWTLFQGHHVGNDEFGNRYYTDRKKRRRWVIFNGPAEASTIPPGWHGWMHHRTDTPPTEESYAGTLVGSPAPGQPHRHRRRLSAGRFDSQCGAASAGHRRLRGVVSRILARRVSATFS